MFVSRDDRTLFKTSLVSVVSMRKLALKKVVVSNLGPFLVKLVVLVYHDIVKGVAIKH